jgi:hypothetical protein
LLKSAAALATGFGEDESLRHPASAHVGVCSCCRSIARSLRAASIVAVVLAVAPATQARSASWSTPQPLASSRGAYGQLAAVRSAQGDETVVWRRQTGHGLWVEAATRHADAAWEHAVLYSSLREGPAELALGSDASGTATLAWLNEVPNSSARRIEALERPSSSGWRGPVRVIHRKIEPNQIALAVAPDGRAALAFTTETGASIAEDEGVQLVLRGSRGRWFRSSALPRHGLDSSPQVAMLPGGETMMAWVRVRGPGSESVQAVVIGPRGRAIGPVQTLASHQRKPELHLAGNPRGDLVLVWGLRSGPLVAATRTPGARFGRPVPISPGNDSEVSAAVDTRGDATVLFTHLLATNVPVANSNQGLAPTGAQRTAVQDATRPAARGWRSPVAIPSPADVSTLSPRIVAAPNSDALLGDGRAPTGSVRRHGERSLAAGTGARLRLDAHRDRPLGNAATGVPGQRQPCRDRTRRSR